MKDAKKIISNAFLVLYAGIYLWTWKLFLDVEWFSFLKPYAVVFIASAFICLVLAKIKRQIPFLSFFIGSIFGPLGILMFAFSSPDLRTVKKNGKFYETIGKEIDKLRPKINDAVARSAPCEDLNIKVSYLGECLGLKLRIEKANNFLLRMSKGNNVVNWCASDLEKDFQDIIREFEKQQAEYHACDGR